MKDGRRPPMHVEAVSEGERGDKQDDESAPESDGGKVESADADVFNTEEQESAELGREQAEDKTHQDQEGPEDKTDDPHPSEDLSPSPERPTTPARKRRSRSRARSRGSKDLRNKMKTPPPAAVSTANESSADEYGLDDRDIPPSPPVVSPIPSHFAAFQASRLLRSPISPGSPLPMFYPGTTPSTPMLPSLDEIQKGIGLFRSNSVGAARMMAMQKLTGGSEPMDMTLGSPSPTPLGRNNTVAGGERIAARRNLLRRLGERVKEADTDVTSGGEELVRPVTPGTTKRRRRRSKRSSSRASTLLDDREEQPLPSSAANTPMPPPSPLPPQSARNTESPFLFPPEARRTPVQPAVDEISSPMGGRGVVVEEEDDDADRFPLDQRFANGLRTPARRVGQRLPHSSDAPSTVSTDSAQNGVSVPFFVSSSQSGTYKPDSFPASPFATPLREKPFGDEDEESDAYRELRLGVPSRNARASEISWVAEPGACCYSVVVSSQN